MAGHSVDVVLEGQDNVEPPPRVHLPDGLRDGLRTLGLAVQDLGGWWPTFKYHAHFGLIRRQGAPGKECVFSLGQELIEPRPVGIHERAQCASERLGHQLPGLGESNRVRDSLIVYPHGLSIAPSPPNRGASLRRLSS